MFKSYRKLIVLLFILASAKALGQSSGSAFEIFVRKYTSFSPVDFYTENRYLSAHHLPDTLNIKITSPAQLQGVLRAGLTDKVYSVEIDNSAMPDLNNIIALLIKFHNLEFLKISDPLFARSTQTEYKLPPIIQQLQQLKALELFYTNKLDMDDAVEKIASLNELEVLVFTGYQHPLPAAIAQLTNINAVKLSSENIENTNLISAKWTSVVLTGSAPTAGPDERALARLADVKTLQNLYMEYCMPGDAAVLSKFGNLKTLSFQTGVMPPNVQFFKTLNVLSNLQNLSVGFYNDTTQTIYGIENLKQLRNLNISRLATLHSRPEQLNALNGLENLESLTLSSCKLSFMPDIFKNLSHLKRISLADNNFTQIPSSLFNLPNIEYIDVSSNQLSSLPDAETYGCKNLKTLNVSYNALGRLPAATTSLINLEKLNASANKIMNIPGDWQRLTNLKEINLQRNRLTTYPAGLQEIIKLEKIDLSYNAISSIPGIESSNYQLKDLTLSGNELTALPSQIDKYTLLETLSVDGNRLESLPESLGNCKNLKVLDVRTIIRTMAYDADKPERVRFITTVKDSSKHNNIKILPAGLKDAKNLEWLQITGNPSLNSKSVFDVILAVPRNGLRVNLSDDNITELPASTLWANMKFYELDLSHNQIKTLPVEFAAVNLSLSIDLTRNLIQTSSGIYDHRISNKADIKLLYDEMGIALPGNILTNQEYAAALTAGIPDFYNSKKWNKAVEYAQKAIAADTNTYNQKVRWDEIGTARYNTKDYNGAIADFNRFIVQEEKSFVHIMNFITPVEEYKVAAHIALGEKEAAAKTYEYFGKKYGTVSSLINAAIIYKELGNMGKYGLLADSALSQYNSTMNKYNKQKSIPKTFILDYSEALIIAGKPNEAVDILNKETATVYTKQELAIKNYLQATANYFIQPQAYNSLKNTLADYTEKNGKVTGWDFAMFNKWLQVSGYSSAQKEQVLALQNLVK